MIGPYLIHHHGQTFHGDISLQEHHLFYRQESYYLFRPRDMVALRIGPTLAKAILKLIPGPGCLIPDALMQALRDCGLVPGMATASHMTKDTELRHPASKTGQPIVHLSLFLAQLCNMRCVYCYGGIGGEFGGRGKMSQQTARAAVDWLLEQSLDATKVHVGFFGGEPLLNMPVLKHIVTYTRQEAELRGKQVEFDLTTNGTLLGSRTIAYLAEENINPLISFDGPADLQNRQRPFRNGQGSYGRVYANIQQLRATFPHLTARATVFGDGEPLGIHHSLQAAGFTHCILSLASPQLASPPERDDSREEGREADTTRSQAADRMLAYRRRVLEQIFIAIRQRRLDPRSAPLLMGMLAGLASGRKRHVACGVGRWRVGIAATGDIYPCHRFVGQKKFQLGHIRDYRTEGTAEYHLAVVDRLPKCRFCWARYFCGGGCFYDNLARTGDMHTPDTLYCREIQTLCEDLIQGWCHLDESDKTYVREQFRVPGLIGNPGF